MGYIAPEMLSRNLGNVSYKSDVFSYGMLLLEMIGDRKNIDITMDNTSQVYFCFFKRTGIKRSRFGPKKEKKTLGLLFALCNPTLEKKRRRRRR